MPPHGMDGFLRDIFDHPVLVSLSYAHVFSLRVVSGHFVLLCCSIEHAQFYGTCAMDEKRLHLQCAQVRQFDDFATKWNGIDIKLPIYVPRKLVALIDSRCNCTRSMTITDTRDIADSGTL